MADEILTLPYEPKIGTGGELHLSEHDATWKPGLACTVEQPNAVNAEASRDRLELAGEAHCLAMAADAAETVQAQRWHECWAALVEVGRQQAEHQQAEDPAKRFIALIGAALASRKAHLGDARNQDRAPNDAGELGWELRPIGRNELEEYQPRGDRIGWVEKGVAYLEPKAAYGMAQRMASSEGQVLSVGDRTLWRRLHEAGLLAKHDKDRNTCSKRIGERPRKTIAITLDQLLASYDAAKSGTTGTVGTGVPEAADSLGPVPDLRSRHKGTGNGNRSEADRGFQVDGSRCSQCPRSPETKEAEIERGFM